MDDSLSFESFYEGAQKAAHRAMDDHGRGEYDEFALHAGVAIERLAKAVLVSKNPIYIVEIRGNVSTDMLFHMGGHREAKKVRTVGASEAVSRLRTLEVLAPDKELDLLIDLRNGVAHASAGDQARPLLPTLAKTMEALHAPLERNLDWFWGRWSDTVRITADHQRNESEREVQVRIIQAAHRFKDRFDGLPSSIIDKNSDQQRRWFYAGVHKETGVPGPLATWVICPACEVDYGLVFLQSQYADGENGPDIFSCRLCGLHLTGREEFDIAQLTMPPIPEEMSPLLD
ncbi:hypothetical protein OH738_10840 [Streptomyces hirsutus]|uniref:hypothetical protein n=1 Tax=Streptomyces hirsutus TaxID=35620 RepID=UPI003864C00D|nr:hypothetical protein OH738_10840 [Streptomyces hirsutus]